MAKRSANLLPVLGLALWAAGCSVGLDLPDGAQLACTSDADCPSGWRCNTNRNRCQSGDTNSVPVATVRAVPAATRAATALDFDVIVSDADGAPAGQSHVDLTVSYTLDGVTFCPATLTAAPKGLAATAAGASHTLTWDLLADSTAGGTQSAACSLPVVELDRKGDGTLTTVVAYTAGVRLRAVATDDGTPAQSSAPTVGEPFAVGDQAPVAALDIAGPTVSLAVPVTLRAVDAAADLVDVELQFRLASDPADGWRLPALQGAVTDLVSAATLGAAQPSLVVWHTDAALGTAQKAGGVGLTNAAGVVVRARAVDHALPGAPVYGPWAQATVDVVNQSPPIVGSVAIYGGENGAASGLAFVEYQVVDRQKDAVDVEVEWRRAGAATWRAATAYPSPQHSGRHGLSTDADATTTTLHTFAWDVGADLPDRADDVEVRVRAADDTAASGWVVVGVPFAAGVDSVRAFDATHRETQTLATLGSSPLLLSGDFNGDKVVDLVGISSVSSGIRLWPGTAAGGLGAPADLAGVSGRMRGAVGDFNGDGFDDLAIRTEVDDARFALGGAGGLTLSPQVLVGGSLNTVASKIAAGDLDGDGKDDLAISTPTGIRLFRSNGDGTFTQDLDLAVGMPWAIAIGDFDGDGVGDLAYAFQSGSGSGDPTGSKRVPIAIQVRRGVKGAKPTLVSATVEDVASGLATFVDSTSPVDAALAVGDVDGDGVDELLAADIYFVGTLRARVLSRRGGWHALAQAETLGTALAIHWDAPGPSLSDGRVVVAAAGAATAWAYDVDAQLLRLSAQPLAGTSVDLRAVRLGAKGIQPATVVTTASAARVFADTTAAAIPAASFTAFGSAPAALGTRNLLVGDVDGDGLADVLVADALRASLRTVAPFLGTSRSGQGALGLEAAANPSLLFPDGVADQGASDYVGFADVTGDGALDVLLTGEPGSYFVTAATGPADPFHFARGVFVNANGGAQKFGFVDGGDFDDDGREDALYHEAGALWVSLSRGASATGPVTSWVTAQVNPGFSVSQVAIGDLDGDGVEDLVATGGTSVAAWIATPGGPARFAAPCTLTEPAAVLDAAVGDVDGDGRNEVVVTTAAAVYVHGFTGACPLVLEKTSTSASGLNTIRLVDMNADGTLDLVGFGTTVGPFPVQVQMGLETSGKPNGDFGPPISTGVTVTGDAWGVGDADRDGIPELYGTNSTSTTNTLVSFPGARWLGEPAWTASQALSALRPGVAGPAATDRFGKPRALDLVVRPVTDRSSVLGSARATRDAFVDRMLAAGVTPLAAGWKAVSKPWRIEGDWLSDATDGVAGRTVTARSQLASWGAGTLVGVDLPLYGTTAGTDWTATQARVVCRETTGWLGDGAGGLARTADGRTRWLPTETWVELPRDADGDLSTGTGARFTVVAGRVRLLLDHLGTCRAFAP
ncbi:MAG: VCBS repeat-containing protein [Anaeromyxobacter sp.]